MSNQGKPTEEQPSGKISGITKFVLKQTQQNSIDDVCQAIVEGQIQNQKVIKSILELLQSTGDQQKLDQIVPVLVSQNFVDTFIVKYYCEKNDLHQVCIFLQKMSQEKSLHRRDIICVLDHCSKMHLDDYIFELAEKLWKLCKKHEIQLTEDDYINFMILSKEKENVLYLFEEMNVLFPILDQETFLKLQFCLPSKLTSVCQIDRNTCTCSSCHSQLSDYVFTEYHKEKVLKNLIEKQVANKDEAIVEKFEAFQKFIEEKVNDKFDVILDGANVGRFKSNFVDRKEGVIPDLDYQSIQSAVNFFRSGSKRVLIVLHEQHDITDDMNDDNKILIQLWKDEQMVYFTPEMFNDDFYWSYASIYLTNPKENQKTFIVTNDRMMNHYYSENNQRYFDNWKYSHRVGMKYMFDQKQVYFIFPSKFAITIQVDRENHTVHVPVKGADKKITWHCAKVS